MKPNPQKLFKKERRGKTQFWQSSPRNSRWLELAKTLRADLKPMASWQLNRPEIRKLKD